MGARLHLTVSSWPFGSLWMSHLVIPNCFSAHCRTAPNIQEFLSPHSGSLVRTSLLTALDTQILLGSSVFTRIGEATMQGA
jgi:hypothetical protein